MSLLKALDINNALNVNFGWKNQKDATIWCADVILNSAIHVEKNIQIVVVTLNNKLKELN